MQEGDDVRALIAARQGSGRDGRAVHGAARIGQKLIELIIRPGAAFGLHGGGIVEPRLGGALPTDDAPEIGTDAVRFTLLEGMARLALLGRTLATLGGGGSEQRLDRLLLLLLRARANCSRFPDGDRAAGRRR